MTTLQSALANLRKCEAKFDFHMKHPGDDDAFTKAIEKLVSATELAWDVHDGTDLGRVVLFAAMSVSKKLLVDLFFYLSRNDLIERIFIIHPDPELLSNAVHYSIWCRDKKLQDFANKTSQKAIELGGFLALDRAGEILRDFDTDTAPAPSLCTQLLTNTFLNLDQFVAGDHYNSVAIRYISVLLSKIIDEGDASWAFEFIDQNLEPIESVCPILFSRLGSQEDVSYRDKFLVNLLNYIKTERFYTFLAHVDEDAFERMLSQPEALKMIANGALSRSNFDISNIPLSPSVVEKILAYALDRNLKDIHHNCAPLRLIDIERFHAAYLNAGLTTGVFYKKLSSHKFVKASKSSSDTLTAEIGEASRFLIVNPKKLGEMFKSHSKVSLDFCIVCHYMDEKFRDLVERNLSIVSGLYASQGHDFFDSLGISRGKVFLEDFIALSTSSSTREVSDLAEKWMDSGVLLSEASKQEVRGLPKQNLAVLVKRASEVFTTEELRRISWLDGGITDDLIGNDLGL